MTYFISRIPLQYKKIAKWKITLLLLSITILLFLPNLYSADRDDRGYNIIPIAIYRYLSLDSQIVYSPGAALAIKGNKNLFVGSYKYTQFKEDPLFNVPKTYHEIDFLGDIHQGSWNTLLIFKSRSDKPVAGGLRTFQLGTAVGYNLFFGNTASIIIGGGIAVSDFGVVLPNGKPLPVIPVPLIRYSNEWKLLKLSFDFLTGPNVSLTLAPQKKIRVTADVRMDRFRDAGDIIFESILWYRFFDSSHKLGDFAGIGVGMKRDELAFDLANRSDAFSVQYNSAFAVLDLSLLKIQAGLTFNAIERHGDDFKTTINNGFFIEFQLLYQF